MSMSPITRTIQGQSQTFMLSAAAMTATIVTPLPSSYAEAWQTDRGVPQMAGGGYTDGVPSATSWANLINAAGNASTSAIEPKEIEAVLRESLIGGGMATDTAIDTAQRLRFCQTSCQADLLAAEIVLAAVAAAG